MSNHPFPRLRVVALAALCAASCGSLGQAAAASGNARLFVLTDIGNEPDDQMSLVRLLLYSNEIDIEGIAATTSVWQRNKTSPELAVEIIDAYSQVVPRLREHAPGWPEGKQLQERVYRGNAGYGLAAVNRTQPSDAALALVAALQRPDPRPLWVSLWGGANTLAEALAYARDQLAPGEMDGLIGKLRVYSISDQDDAGPWIRAQFPSLFYIVSPSTQDGADYARATWTGISGDVYYRNGTGADFGTVTNEWLERNIRAKGPLGKRYLRYKFIMEGDTPGFLGLIPNGLQPGDHPNWGGWGGRYVLRQPVGETRPIWTQGGDAFSRVTSSDTVNGVTSDQATIWRWRTAFQNDFAARMDWTIKPFKGANHPPLVAIDGRVGAQPIDIELAVGEKATLDASRSTDPDGQRLTYRWFQYDEAGYEGAQSGTPPLGLTNARSAKVTLSAADTCRPGWLGQAACPVQGVAHLILAVTDDGAPQLTSYRRVVVHVHR
ncbi:MAG: hypothetical protein RL684_306 [Pseudomonadota bacterium]|jgi:hypothetical protein